MVILSIVGAGAFGVGYFAKEREDLMARDRLLERQLAARDQIASLERQIRELELVQSEEVARRATIVKVDLNDVFAPVREGVARAAVTRFDILAAGITADLERLVQADLLKQIKAAETELTASTDAARSELPVGGDAIPTEDVALIKDLPFVTPTVFPAPLAVDPLVSFAPRVQSTPRTPSKGPRQ